VITNGTAAIIDVIEKRLTQLDADIKTADWECAEKSRAEMDARHKRESLRNEQITLKRTLKELKDEQPR
jgi:hypothetical protein